MSCATVTAPSYSKTISLGVALHLMETGAFKAILSIENLFTTVTFNCKT